MFRQIKAYVTHLCLKLDNDPEQSIFKKIGEDEKSRYEVSATSVYQLLEQNLITTQVLEVLIKNIQRQALNRGFRIFDLLAYDTLVNKIRQNELYVPD